jgi:hypothetical protein
LLQGSDKRLRKKKAAAEATANLCRHPEVLAALRGEPRRMGHKRTRPSFETPRKRAAPQDDGEEKDARIPSGQARQ